MLPNVSPETPYQPTLTANITDVRVFSRLYFGLPFPYRTEIEVVNASAGILTFRSDGRSDTIPAGAKKRYKTGEGWDIFRSYSLTSNVTTNANEITVYERGGIYRAD